MKKSLAIYAGFTLLAAWCLASPARNQEQMPAIKVQVRLVEVYASIHDQKGHFVDGLSRESFQVLEDGKPQQIDLFDSTSQSLSCAILLDTTGSMNDALPRVKNSIVKL